MTAVWFCTDPGEQYWNAYSYCGGNPVNLLDRWGMQAEDTQNESNGKTQSEPAPDGGEPGDEGNDQGGNKGSEPPEGAEPVTINPDVFDVKNDPNGAWPLIIIIATPKGSEPTAHGAEPSNTVANTATGPSSQSGGGGGGGYGGGYGTGYGIGFGGGYGGATSSGFGVVDALQTTLDVVGLVPGIGEPFDLANAGISLIRGRYGEAALGVAAAIPILGWGGTAGKAALKYSDDAAALINLAKGAKRTGASADDAATLLKWADEVGLPRRGPEIHPGRNFSDPHIHIGPVNHIKVR